VTTYKSLLVEADLFDTSITIPLDKILNQEAEDGWELHIITPHKAALIVTFRRPA
jgi:hypothetical protein